MPSVTPPEPVKRAAKRAKGNQKAIASLSDTTTAAAAASPEKIAEVAPQDTEDTAEEEGLRIFRFYSQKGKNELKGEKSLLDWILDFVG